MSENIPQTLQEIAAAIGVESSTHLIYKETADQIAKSVLRWREAWLRDAEPRLRPVTEKPQEGDTVVTVYDYGGVGAHKSWGRLHTFTSGCTGWYLLKSAPVPLTHESALRLLVSDIRSLGSPPEQLLVALAKAEEALQRRKP